MNTFQNGQLKEAEDSAGSASKTFYIETGPLKGKIDYAEDALGHRTYFTYYKSGDADLGTSPVGSVRESFLLEKPATGDFDLQTTSLRRNWTKSTYYSDGLVKSTIRFRTGQGASGNVTYAMTTEYKYDVQGRVTETKQFPSNNPFTAVDESAAPYLALQQFNELSQLVVSTDRYGRETRYYYDQRGNLVQTLYPSGPDAIGGTTPPTLTRTVYDVNNRPIYQQSAQVGPAGPNFHNTQTTSFGTRTIYDALGRVVRAEKRTGIQIRLKEVANVDSVVIPNMYTSELDSEGSLVECTDTEYDSIGRVTRVTDTIGRFQKFVYQDAAPAVPGLPAIPGETLGTPPTPAQPARKTTFAGSWRHSCSRHYGWMTSRWRKTSSSKRSACMMISRLSSVTTKSCPRTLPAIPWGTVFSVQTPVLPR